MAFPSSTYVVTVKVRRNNALERAIPIKGIMNFFEERGHRDIDVRISDSYVSKEPTDYQDTLDQKEQAIKFLGKPTLTVRAR